MEAISDFLQHTSMFSAFSIEEIEKVVPMTTLRGYKKNEILFYQGDKSTRFYILQKGRIKIYRITSGGKEQIYHIVVNGESFSEAASFADMNYPANAQALEDSKVICFSKNVFLSHLNRKPELAIKMLTSMSMKLKRLTDQVHALASQNVEERLAGFIIKKMGSKMENGAKFNLNIGKHILASQLGTTPETLSRTLRKFKKNNIISSYGKTITIISVDALYALSD